MQQARPDETFDAIILGAGGAGLMCAAVAGQRGRRILLLDHADAPGKKILISGGGRCNFTNINAGPEQYLSANRHFMKSAMRRYTPADFIALVDAYGIAWHEKTLGQLFCDGSARQVVAMLLAECAKGGVDVQLGYPVRAAGPCGRAVQDHRRRANDRAPQLVIATGGPSIPKLGATGFAYDVARRFGLKIVEPRPALVPLTLGGDQVLFRELSGVATEVVASAGKASFREAALFTHRGLSGPAILQVSTFWRHGEDILIDFLPDAERGWLRASKRMRPSATVGAALRNVLPARLADTLSDRLGIAGDIGNVTDKRLEEAEQRLRAWSFRPNGTEGFAKAEVTAGGIATEGLSSQTMEAKSVPGLYAIGEAVDVTGWLGGYNFQWAWASGWAAGQAL